MLCNLKSEALGRKLPDWPVWRNSLRMIKGHSSEGGGHSPHSGLQGASLGDTGRPRVAMLTQKQVEFGSLGYCVSKDQLDL